MTSKDFLYDGSRRLDLREAATAADDALRDQKDAYKKRTGENMKRAAALQDRLLAAGQEALVIAVQARDAAGKDSLVRKLLGQLNPAGLTVHAFKTPSAEELSHDYLWRLNAALPPRGKIAVFNRTQYEDVLAVRVHHLEKTYALAPRCLTDDFFERRFRQIRDWERYLYENGVRMVKIMLNVSREEQAARFIDRMERGEKHWKLSLNDMKERALWDEYTEAYEDAVNATAEQCAPWYVIPADDKWYVRWIVSEILLDTLTEMAPAYPPLNAADAAQIPYVMEQLAAERATKKQ